MAGLEAYIDGVPANLGAFANDPMGAATAALEARRRQQITDAGYDPEQGLYDRYSAMLGSVLGPTIAERAGAARDAMRRGDMASANSLSQSLALDFGQFLGSIKPIRAYHGSPHDFDKFSMDKIGSGEGAQAYGHGLYFAENEGVARSYRDALKYRALVDPSASPLDPRRIAGELYESWQGDIAGALDDARHYGNAKSIISELRKIGANPPTGRMYEVNIHADPSRFLDWDAPLSAQTPPVRSALNDLGVRLHEPEWTVRQSPSGRWTVYNVWGESSGTFKDKGAAEAKAAAGTRDHNVGAAGLAYTRLGGNHVYGSLDGGGASQALNDAGIPGIKYLDKGSRSAGDGTRNYVVFDDKLIEILRKYGIMAPAAGLGALATYGSDDPNL